MSGIIVFIGSSDVGAGYCAQAAIALGYEPLFLCGLSEYQADPKSQILRHPHIDCEDADPESLLDTIRRHHVRDIAGVTTFMDTRLTTACELARRLGVRGPDKEVPRLKGKAAVSRLIADYSPASVSFHLEAPPRAELARLFEGSARIIVKPSEGAGALGAFYLQPGELDTLADRIATQALPKRLRDGEWMAQAAIEGELVSAEGFVVRSQPWLLGFSSRKRVRFTESGAAFPADRLVSEAATERCKDAIRALVRRSGFQNGYFHIEFIVNASESWLIDANMGRIGGGPIAELLALSYGVEPVEIFKHAIEVSLFGQESARVYGTFDSRRETYAILYGLEHGGVLEEVLIPEDSPCYHTQIVDRGAPIGPMGESDLSWIGILSGYTKDTFDTIERMRIRSMSGEFRPAY